MQMKSAFMWFFAILFETVTDYLSCMDIVMIDDTEASIHIYCNVDGVLLSTIETGRLQVGQAHKI